MHRLLVGSARLQPTSLPCPKNMVSTTLPNDIAQECHCLDLFDRVGFKTSIIGANGPYDPTIPDSDPLALLESTFEVLAQGR